MHAGGGAARQGKATWRNQTSTRYNTGPRLQAKQTQFVNLAPGPGLQERTRLDDGHVVAFGAGWEQAGVIRGGVHVQHEERVVQRRGFERGKGRRVQGAHHVHGVDARPDPVCTDTIVGVCTDTKTIGLLAR